MASSQLQGNKTTNHILTRSVTPAGSAAPGQGHLGTLFCPVCGRQGPAWEAAWPPSLCGQPAAPCSGGPQVSWQGRGGLALSTCVLGSGMCPVTLAPGEPWPRPSGNKRVFILSACLRSPGCPCCPHPCKENLLGSIFLFGTGVLVCTVSHSTSTYFCQAGFEPRSS
jgi:hypothetical protein